MSINRIVGRALGLLLALLLVGVGAALVYSQFHVGWTGGRPNDGVTFTGYWCAGFGIVALGYWIATACRSHR